MLTAILTSGVMTALLPIVLKALTQGLLDYMAQQQARGDQIALGQSRAVSTINREAADAERRAVDATFNVPALGGVIDDLRHGVF